VAVYRDRCHPKALFHRDLAAADVQVSGESHVVAKSAISTAVPLRQCLGHLVHGGQRKLEHLWLLADMTFEHICTEPRNATSFSCLQEKRSPELGSSIFNPQLTRRPEFLLMLSIANFMPARGFIYLWSGMINTKRTFKRSPISIVNSADSLDRIVYQC